jgi:hypothetical protein
MIRVFPRRTNATPDDELAFTDGPPLWHIDGHDVMVSCTFTYDKPRAEQLADQWQRQGYKVQIGGPAYDDRGDEFVQGRFVKPGYVITSRGCNNRCWFCYVPKREGGIRELPIVNGWNVLDSNLLQCSEHHIRSVFDMLGRQDKRAIFTGGIESRILEDWHVELLHHIKPERFYFAYDTPDDWEPLVIAAQKTIGLCTNHNRSCYVLIGYPKDTFEQAEIRLKQTMDLGLTPMAMLYRDDKGKVDNEWRKFQRLWARPTIIYGKV